MYSSETDYQYDCTKYDPTEFAGQADMSAGIGCHHIPRSRVKGRCSFATALALESSFL